MHVRRAARFPLLQHKQLNAFRGGLRQLVHRLYRSRRFVFGEFVHHKRFQSGVDGDLSGFEYDVGFGFCEAFGQINASNRVHAVDALYKLNVRF
jgi:hypothetical protein